MLLVQRIPKQGSESSDFRVACGIAQVNIGYSYITETLERLNIEPVEYCTSHATMMDKKKTTSKLRKEKKDVKYRRNQNSSKLARSEKKKEKHARQTLG